MSLERAQANCERCYTLADRILRDMQNEISQDTIPTGYTSREEKIKTTIYKSDKITNARNDAMKALESLSAICFDTHLKMSIGLEKTNAALTSKALEACAECNFTEPKISNLVKK